jgi:glycosyltransferase involved in cell wall biosynthesis
MHLLICDINIKEQGHNIGYNQYILDYCCERIKNGTEIHFSFLFNSEAKTLLRLDESLVSHIYYVDTNDDIKEGWKYKFKLFKKTIAIAYNLQVDKMIFLDIDKYQLFIFISRFNFKISGILFRPHHRIESSNKGFKNRLGSLLKRTKKIVAEWMLITKNAVENIFILNDADGILYLNQYHSTTKFSYLPDPIFSFQPKQGLEKLGIEKNNSFKFLVFGALNERKNITNILKAYENASFDYATELILIGPSKKSYSVYLENLVQSISVKDLNNKEIIVHNSFVSDQQMDWFFLQSDVIMLVYKDFYGSSGLLGRACMHQKKVIGPNVGLLRNMITDYQLGLLCDPNSTEEIARAMISIKVHAIGNQGFLNFYSEHSPDKFIETLLFNTTL